MLPSDADIGVLLLAAGRSSRFGQDKLVAPFRGRPLWEWSAIAAEEAGFANRFLVVSQATALSTREGWRMVENPDAHDGMGTSIATGVRAASACSRLVIALADMPLVPPAHLVKLAEGQGSIFTRYDGEAYGCPAAFPASAFPKLAALTGESGARSLDLPDATILEPADTRLLCDIDTRPQLDRLDRL